MRTWLGRGLRRPRRPGLFGLPRRTRPVSESWGYDRGTPIDRYFIEQFLGQHRNDIRGRVLEVGDSRYTERFGTEVDVSDVLDVVADNSRATVIGDLGRPDALPEQRWDCVVLTQTLQYVFDVGAAVESVRRLLRPGGVALMTVPSVSRIAASAGVDREFWRFTTAACDGLFRPRFAEVDVRAYGNVLTCAAFLLGLAAEEFSTRELEQHDPYFPLLIAVRAVRAQTS
jgi:SAM-dependent methyltransferase